MSVCVYFKLANQKRVPCSHLVYGPYVELFVVRYASFHSDGRDRARCPRRPPRTPRWRFPGEGRNTYSTGGGALISACSFTGGVDGIDFKSVDVFTSAVAFTCRLGYGVSVDVGSSYAVDGARIAETHTVPTGIGD